MEVNKGWAFLACRILALYFGFLFLQQFVSLPFPYLNSSSNITTYVTIAWSASLLMIVIFLWFGARWLSSKLVADNVVTTDPDPINLDSVLSLAIALLGLLLIVNAFPNIITALVTGYEQSRWLPAAILIEPAIKMAIGVFFIFKANGVARFLKMTRGI
ncbi:MAG: hypothetical protein V7750_11735 [Sneathiella sp.]